MPEYNSINTLRISYENPVTGKIENFAEVDPRDKIQLDALVTDTFHRQAEGIISPEDARYIREKIVLEKYGYSYLSSAISSDAKSRIEKIKQGLKNKQPQNQRITFSPRYDLGHLVEEKTHKGNFPVEVKIRRAA